ncbi:hypothetical protein BX600DRAFT_431045 [Xylariales sp. PMI_506]|nr:hypothetical protein BX600DRAFT_431045 [Xylariales sp. PMI_506]
MGTIGEPSSTCCTLQQLMRFPPPRYFAIYKGCPWCKVLSYISSQGEDVRANDAPHFPRFRVDNELEPTLQKRSGISTRDSKIRSVAHDDHWRPSLARGLLRVIGEFVTCSIATRHLQASKLRLATFRAMEAGTPSVISFFADAPLVPQAKRAVQANREDPQSYFQVSDDSSIGFGSAFGSSASEIPNREFYYGSNVSSRLQMIELGIV